jgi:hypothetical protein
MLGRRRAHSDFTAGINSTSTINVSTVHSNASLFGVPVLQNTTIITAPLLPLPTLDDDAPVAENCLLIPMVILAWWYWSKRNARRVFPYLLTSYNHHRHHQQQPPPQTESEEPVVFATHDPFNSWDEVDEYSVSNDNQQRIRLVQWLKGHKYQAKHRMRRLSRRMLSSRSRKLGCDLYPERMMSDVETVTSTSPLSIESVMSHDTVFSESGRWELIHDVTTVEVRALPLHQSLSNEYSSFPPDRGIELRSFS